MNRTDCTPAEHDALLAREFARIESVDGCWPAYRKLKRRGDTVRLSRADRKDIWMTWVLESVGTPLTHPKQMPSAEEQARAARIAAETEARYQRDLAMCRRVAISAPVRRRASSFCYADAILARDERDSSWWT